MDNNTTGSYLNDILNQPSALRDTLRCLDGQSVPNDLLLRQGEFQQILLTGMGSSYFVFHPLHQALVQRGLHAQMVETAELLHSLSGLLRPGNLVIAASQSGRSAEIVSLVGKKDAGFTLLGITNTSGSPLDIGADARVLTCAGEETTVSCKTYLAALLASAWLEMQLLGDGDASELLAAPDAVEAYLAGWQSHVADLKSRLSHTRDLFIVGRGPSLAAVGTGGLTTKESTHLHAEGMSSPAFRHGPFEMVGPETYVLVLEGPEGPAQELNRRLYADVLAAGGCAGLVSTHAEELVFRLPEVPQRLLPVVEMLPIQMITLALAELRGHVAGRFTHSNKVTTVE